MCRARVHFIRRDQLLQLLTGAARLVLPGDAELIACTPCSDGQHDGIGLRIHSVSYAEIPRNTQLPVTPAVIERRRTAAS